MKENFMNVTSISYNENELNMDYFVDVNEVWWYSYDDICKYLGYNDNVVYRIYKNMLSDNEKQICLDDNNEYREYVEKRFICSNAVRRLIKRVNERTNNLIKVINNLELAVNAHDIYNDAEELKSRFNILKESIENDDYEQSVYQSYEIVNSKSGRDILDKLGVIDKDVEELLDLIRTDIVYYNNLNEIEMTLINDEEDFTQVTYTKNNKESTCPSWLRNCVK